jgi:hypothetical protein
MVSLGEMVRNIRYWLSGLLRLGNLEAAVAPLVALSSGLRSRVRVAASRQPVT